VAVEDQPEPDPEEISRRDLFGRWVRDIGRAAANLAENAPGPLGGLVGPGPGELDLIRQIDDLLAHDADHLADDPAPHPDPLPDLDPGEA
jgi:hypothetical protein